MNVDLILSMAAQITIIILFISSVQIKKKDFCYLDNKGTLVTRGIFSLLIVLFHTPVTNVVYNFLGCASNVFIVTMFSLFSTYGMTLKLSENADCLHKIPGRFLRVLILYAAVLLIKYLTPGNMFSGGIGWVNTLLLSYVVFYVAHKLTGGGYAPAIIIVFWVGYGILMRIWPNSVLGWPAQSFGYAYGVALAMYGKKILNYLVKYSKWIVMTAFVLLLPLGLLYLKIHIPEQETLPMYSIRVIMSLILIVLYLTLSIRVTIRNRFLEWVGRMSIYVFLLHGMVIDIADDYFTDGILIWVCLSGTLLAAAGFWLIESRIQKLFENMKIHLTI